MDITENQAKRVWNAIAKHHKVQFKLYVEKHGCFLHYKMKAYPGYDVPVNMWSFLCNTRPGGYVVLDEVHVVLPVGCKNLCPFKALLEKSIEMAKKSNVTRYYGSSILSDKDVIVVFPKGISLEELLIYADLWQ